MRVKIIVSFLTHPNQGLQFPTFLGGNLLDSYKTTIIATIFTTIFWMTLHSLKKLPCFSDMGGIGTYS